MNNYIQLYNDLARLPPLELVQILADVLPIGEIKARMDGTVVLVHAYGLRRFQTTTDLSELGLSEDDPAARSSPQPCRHWSQNRPRTPCAIMYPG